MSIKSRISKWFGAKPIQSDPRISRVAARYDAAQTTEENRKHWSNADALSADGSANPEVRHLLRIRSRYEISNNPIACGIINTLSQHVVSGGPTLTCGDTYIEELWIEWSKRIRLADKLRLSHTTWMMSGEVFVRNFSNPLFRENQIQLDLEIIEPDRVCGLFSRQLAVTKALGDLRPADYFYDGIQYDTFGNPLFYYIQPDFPGEDFNLTMLRAGDITSASSVFHLFRAKRPGQRRGVPEGTPSLDLFALKRRFTKATVTSAETHANLTAIGKTPAPVGSSEEEEQRVAPFTAVDFERNMITFLPEGYDIHAFNPAQPTTTYEMFDAAIVKEIARCFDMPYTIAALDSSRANMSAAYLDWQTYKAARIEPDREMLNGMLAWIFGEWIAEAKKIGLIDAPPEFFEFLWANVGEHADPLKVAKAHETKLASGQTNLAQLHARNGDDWEEQQELAARSLGTTVPEYQALLRGSIFKVPPVGGIPQPEPADDESPANQAE